ncbi:tetratricopeptide repeat protein [Flammeovirga sp. EKP202]|uniref:tetratricopeptide repeat protein n=1 Tax=Flammeovirga sp. EKP202 TaxID=2770592 RepID=UPI00165F7294|nr:tetratricopeptide repeat protein [Flammeovirga sp. EKP202]MBD0403111.1 tetratricopeptide repeat protein [Flammeovirga sp. EKP202]
MPFFSFGQSLEKDTLKIKEHEVSEIQAELDSLLQNNYHLDANALADSVLVLAKETYSNTDLRIILIHKRIAEKFADNGYSNIASQYIQRALAILRSNPTPNYAFIGDMYIYLAQIFRHHQLSNIAINYYEQAMEAYEKAEGREHYFPLVNVYMTLGNFHYEIENFGTASSYYTKASNLISKMDTQYRADMVEILNRIAKAQTRTGAYKIAIKNLNQSILIANKVFGKNSIELANQYESLAEVYLQRGDHQDANEAANKVVKILVGNIGTVERRQTYERKIADTFFYKREYGLSHQWYQKLYADALIANQDFNDFTELTKWYLQIAGKFERVKEDVIALKIYQKILSLNQERFGENNLKAAEVMHLISKCYVRLNDFQQAETYTNKAYAIEWEIGSEKDSTQLAIQNIDMAGLLLMKGDTVEAVKLYHNVEKLEENRESRWKAIAYNNLSMIKFEQKKFTEAYYYSELLLSYYKENYGRDYIKTIGCYLLIGNIIYAQGEQEKAVENYYSKPIRLASHLFRKPNEVSFQANKNLSDYYKNLKKVDLSQRYAAYAREIQVIISSENTN